MMKPMMKMLLAAVLGFAGSAWAQWPDKPIRVVVPYSAGSTGDVLIRLTADEVGNRLGQRLVIDNRTGAGGNIGALAVAQAQPDGYTLLLGATGNFVINQFIYPKGVVDPLKAFEPVTVMADIPTVAYSSASVPAQTFAEFVAYAKANPGKLNYGSPGTGTNIHLALEAINRSQGLGMTHISYRGSPQVSAALLANEVQLALGGVNVGLAHVKTGKMRALAVSNTGRIEMMPEVPTFDEVGMKDIQARTWWAVAAPAGTPSAVLDRLNTAFRAALSTPEVKTRLSELGIIGVGSTRAQMARQMQEEAGQWSRVVKELGITVE
jgi:tripartite-type tricarboxylate transporter receptor subunit TctC